MCGLIGVLDTSEKPEPVNETVLGLFENQKGRGQSGFGLIKIDKKLNFNVDRSTEGYKLMWDIHHNPVPMMIMHHRSPTSTDNLMNQTHPMVVSNGSLKYDYLVIHNGIISNHKDMKKIHEDLGFQYTTEMKKTKDYWGREKEIVYNDSECFAIELARFVEKQIAEMETEGSAAFIALQINKKARKVEQLLFGRTTLQPLILSKTRNFMLLSSEGPGNEIKEKILYACHLDADMKLSHTRIKVKERSNERSYPDSSYTCGGFHYPGHWNKEGKNDTKTEREAKATSKLLESRKEEGCISLKDLKKEEELEKSWREAEVESENYAHGRSFPRCYEDDKWEPEETVSILCDEYNTDLIEIINDFTTDLEYNTLELEELNNYYRTVMEKMEEARLKIEQKKNEIADTEDLGSAQEEEEKTIAQINHAANSALSE